MMDDAHRDLLAQVASKYYEHDLTQNEIADQLGLSRVKVYRMLKEAREAGIVQITIQWSLQRDSTLAAQVKAAFGLRDALILKTHAPRAGSAADVLPQLGQLGARYLESILEPNSTLALCLGRSTYEVIYAIRPNFQSNIQIAQAMGGLPPMQERDSGALARSLARKIDGEAHYLLAPLMANSAADADVMRNQRDILRTLDRARAADVALLGVGNLDPATSKFVQAGVIASEGLQQLAREGAVGDLAGQFFDLDGSLHSCEFNQRVIAINLDDLRRIPITIVVAAGVEKARALTGALRTGAINVLCTDDMTAAAVLAAVGEGAWQSQS
jgi:DNA-binding transcriptional regulator LsrR (DeoR family)